ncbi:MAG TPA: transglutaminase domain-containing protein [Flavobacterium alvei]|nr:transglutaminase domain-containing protein [Flavobacterium alvei]
MSKPLNWYLKRHPLLYKIRFRLVSKNISLNDINNFCYNDINKKNNIPKLFYETNDLIFNEISEKLSDFEKAKTIAIWLKKNIKGGPGLGKSSATALHKMIKGEGGVCSDFSQIFSNFCVINNIKVKEWGLKSLSTDPKVSGGHSFNEVYCPEFQKWIMIDVAKSCLFYQSELDIPLSTIEYMQLKKEKKEIIIRTLNGIDITDNNLLNIFILSNSMPFIITNYDNKTVDYFLEKLDFFPVSIIHGLLILLGKGYRFEFPENF